MQKLRIVHGRSLRDVAATYGCSASHLSRVERGSAKPSRALVEFYEAEFGGDGLLASLFEVVDQAGEQKRRRARFSRVSNPCSQPGDAVEFVDDSPANGVAVAPGSYFVKTWKIKNSGIVSWRGRQLERQGPLTGPGLITSPRLVDVPDAEPGDVVTVGVILKAPGYACTSIAYFKLVNRQGALCFPDDYALGLEVLVRVDRQLGRVRRS